MHGSDFTGAVGSARFDMENFVFGPNELSAFFVIINNTVRTK